METKSGSSKKSRKTLIIVIVVVLTAGLGLYFWLSGGKSESTDNAQLDGNILTVRSSVTAYVNRICFKDNQYVQKGDTLILLDTVVLFARVQQAKAALANARSEKRVSGSKAGASVLNALASKKLAESNDAAITAARAQVDRLQADYVRSQKLFNIKGITQQQLESDRTELQLAEAQLKETVDKQRSALTTAKSQQVNARSDEAQIGSAEALVNQRIAELRVAQEDLRHASVIAPCAGLVTKRSVQAGNYISAGQNLCAIVSQQDLWVSANVKETQLKTIRIGQPVEIEVDAFPDMDLEGEVISFGGATGAKFALMPPDNATGNFVKVVQRVPLRIALKPLKDTAASKMLLPGLSTHVKIKTD
ncbi:HlyD family secretion protein [Mucilaginibacter sp. PAMB04274]|uniref:HlyD family secretion protein n=1 Tax=Mucilaginibacter sp. PAMB04274 TaxID=3138568 RepID=UPI0031F70E3F